MVQGQDLEGVAFEYEFWSESDRRRTHPCHADDRGLGDPVGFVASIVCSYLNRFERQMLDRSPLLIRVV
jgi:hypothetical protein